VALVPVATSALSGFVVARLLPRPDGAGLLLWWAVVLGTSTVVLLLVERVARRFLPLAALLKLTLAFPDEAPSRFSVAVRSYKTSSLVAWAKKEAEAQYEDRPEARATAVLSLAAALNAHDRRTRGHSERVRVLSIVLGEQMGLSQDDLAHLSWAALLHDIGKLTVPSEILNKPGAPDAHEWAVLRRHPAAGARLARPLDGWLGDWLTAIGEHHEKWDGTGYPEGLAGEDIGLAARIVSVTDAYETMTGVRSYKRPKSAADARRELERCAGSQFDPAIVRSFFNVSLGRLTRIAGPIAWLAQLPFIGVLPRAGALVGTVGGPAAAYSGAMAGAAAVTVSALVSVGGPVLPANASTSGGTVGGGQPPAESTIEAEPVVIEPETAVQVEDGSAPDAATADDSSTAVEGPESAGADDKAPPGLDGATPPGQGGTPPGLDGAVPPGQGGTPPGLDGGTPPGQGGTAPGQGAAPGQGGTPPGQTGTGPGQSGTAPGQNK